MRTAFVVVLLGVAIAATHASQNAATIVPTWKNLETWTRYDATLNQTESGLGLQPATVTGGASIAFWAKFPGKTASPPAGEIYVAGAVGPNTNPNVIRAASITFILDEGKPKLTTIDLSSQAMGDELHPSGNIRSAVARMSPDDFLRLTRARAVKARVLHTEQQLTREQLDALKAFARRILPVAGR